MSHTLIRLSLVFTLAGCGPKAVPEPVAPEAPEGSVAAEIEAALDRSVDPCDDFYQFACGGWMASNEIPSDQVRWGRSFSEIAKRNEELLRTILEEDTSSRPGVLYATCMDTEAIDAAGAAPLEPLFAKIDAAADKKAFAGVAGELGAVGVDLLFGAWPSADYEDPDLTVLHILQGGIGLPDRDYYLGDRGASLREGYLAYVSGTLGLAGASEADAAAQAEAIVAFETRLAEISRPRSELYDPSTTHHRKTRAELAELSPGMDFEGLFAGLGHDVQAINVMTPEYFEALSTVLDETDLDTLKAYARYHTAAQLTPYLSSAFVDQRFAFFGKQLSGQQEQRPRWKRCVSQVDRAVGELLGKAYVDRAFAGASKDIALEMIGGIEKAFEEGLADLEWMDDDTRAKAAEKAQQVTNKIGYPDEWETYEGLDFESGQHFANMLAVNTWGVNDALAKVGQPVDKTEWYMSPPTVNAYYNPSANEIVFPAGILQAPFFDASYPRALNYGAIGMVVGHELTHGFDDDGRKFDGAGKMHEWWAPEVAERFEERAACVVEQYGGYEVEGTALNGELTLGENIADLGGIKQAYRAYVAWVEANGAEADVAGFTPEQLVFLGFAQSWCSEATPEYAVMQATVDSHSPAQYRVHGSLVNTPEFGEAFGCEVGSPMRPSEDEICEVW